MDTIESYLNNISDDRRSKFDEIFHLIEENLPAGFELHISYGMPTWGVPLATYPSGYHCKKDTPLPFVSLAAQKNSINLYHMGLYADAELYDWFSGEFLAAGGRKTSLGKSCLRLKPNQPVPEKVLAGLLGKISVETWIEMYEAAFRKP